MIFLLNNSKSHSHLNFNRHYFTILYFIFSTHMLDAIHLDVFFPFLPFLILWFIGRIFVYNFVEFILNLWCTYFIFLLCLDCHECYKHKYVNFNYYYYYLYVLLIWLKISIWKINKERGVGGEVRDLNFEKKETNYF